MQAAIPLAIAGASSALSVSQAQSQNRAISQSIGSTQSAGAIQLSQNANQAEQRRQRRIAELQRVTGALQVAQADSGVGYGGTYQRLQEASTATAAIDTATIRRNQALDALSIQSAISARVQQLASQRVSPIVAAFTGALQGAGTGLNIASGVEALGEASAATGGLDTLYQVDSAAPINPLPDDVALPRYDLPRTSIT